MGESAKKRHASNENDGEQAKKRKMARKRVLPTQARIVTSSAKGKGKAAVNLESDSDSELPSTLLQFLRPTKKRPSSTSQKLSGSPSKVKAVVEICSDTEEDRRPRKKAKGRITGEIIDLCQSSADERRKAPPTTPVRIREDNGVVTILSTDEEDEVENAPMSEIRKKAIAPLLTSPEIKRPSPSAVPNASHTPNSHLNQKVFTVHSADEDDEEDNTPITKVKRKVIASPISSPESRRSSSAVPDAPCTRSPQIEPATPPPDPPLAPGQLQQLYTQALQNAIPSEKAFGSTRRQRRPAKLPYKVASVKQPADFPVLSHKFFSEGSIDTLLGPKALREVRRRRRKSASAPSRQVPPETVPQAQSLPDTPAFQPSPAAVTVREGSTAAEMQVDDLELPTDSKRPFDIIPPSPLPPTPTLDVEPSGPGPLGPIAQLGTDISVLIEMLTEVPLETPVEESNSLLEMDFAYPS